MAIGWIINSWADSLALLYAGAVVSGIGAGAVYATSVGNGGPNGSPTGADLLSA